MNEFSILTFAAAVSFCCLKVYAEEELLLITVATEENDGFRRYLRSIKKYNLDYKVFGLGETWKGGDMTNQGGGHKVNLLKEGLNKYRNRDDLILMFTDSYDVVITAGKEDILAKFHKMDARVVFSAEPFCWPDRTLALKYPEVKPHEKKYLCSGGFMGYARDIYEIVSYIDVDNTDDDQLYYTDIFLKESLRVKWNMKLDKRSDIFMNLHGALEEVMLKFKGSHSYLFNVKTGTQPVVIHGNGPIKPEFNRIANYLADSWTTSNGCMACGEDVVNVDGMKEDDYPTIVMGLFIEQPTPFLREFLAKIALLDYPKQRIDLFLHNNVALHNLDVKQFLDVHGGEYRSYNFIPPEDFISETTARNWALEECEKKGCKYYFSVDGDAHLDNSESLKLLVQQNRTVLAPLVARWGKAWSNFWGALSETGYYARSEDYMDIVHLERKGVWNVPYITAVYLVQGHVIPSIREAYTSADLDPDMAFCKSLREKGHFLFVTNLDNHGHMINKEDSDMTHKNNELFELINNPYDWEKRYIHANYSQSMKEDALIEQPCPDVFWFPIVTEQFCDDLVDEMEHFGQWSGGKSEDKRLAGGYENVPTDDIHMNQIGLEKQWLKFLSDYIAPLATKVYPGYYSHSNALLNFVVKYHPDRQRELRPHHDSSTFTINIALNHPLVDFEGGGCRFIRYNCSVTSTRKGWMLMHPGRLTHFHEGLQVTKGTRYIMVSFVDP